MKNWKKAPLLPVIVLLFFTIHPLPAQIDQFAETPVKILSLDNWANDVEISPFGTYIAVATRDNQVRILDPDYKQLFIFRGKADYANVNALGFTHDEKYLLFIKNNSEMDLGLVDLESMEITGSLTGHTKKLYCFKMSPDGRFAASGGYNGELIIWNRLPGGFDLMQQITVPEFNIRKLVFSADGRYLAAALHNDTVALYILKNDQFVYHQNLAPTQYYGNTDYLHGVAFSPDGGLLAAGLRNELTLWELQGDEFQVKQVISDVGPSYIQCLEFSPDGSLFACGFGRGEVRFWGKRGGQWTEFNAISGKQDYVQDLEFSPDGKRLATGSRHGNTVIFRDLTGLGPDPVMELSAAAGLPFSRAQKGIIDRDLSLDILSRLDKSLSGPKDEFETRGEYEDRLTRQSAQALRLIQDYTEEFYKVRELSEPGTPGEVEIPLETLLQYNIEEERYFLRFMNTSGYLTIPRNDARTLKQNWSDAVIRARRSESPDGVSYAYSRFVLIHPVSGIRYDLQIDENPFRAVPVDKTAAFIFEKQIGPHLMIKNLILHDIFPVFYRYYADNTIGSGGVTNTGEMPIENLHISLFIQNYMDNPKECAVPRELGVGRNGELALYALLNSKVLELSEGDTLSVKISIGYSAGGKEYSGDIIQSVRLYDRNAIMWDDDKKVAAFVTAKDPAILRYSKRVIGMVEEPAGAAFNRNLLQGMRLFEGMRASGLTYIVDPSTPYSDFSKTGTAIDFLQFPRQTLEYGAGDCDDLSILYNALLESIGIKTAFITVPGHIFTAFDTGVNPEDALRLFSKPGELIFIDGKTWLPVETTALDDGFLHAWELGLGLYNRYSALDEVNFFSTEEGWSRYEPVGISSNADVSVPGISRVTENYAAEVAKYRDKEIFSQEKKLLDEIAADENNIAVINKLGILYSRYGSYDSALEQFEKALALDSYLPAIMNKGNVHSILGDYDAALEYFTLAAAEHPNNPRILLSLTTLQIERGELSRAAETFRRLKELDPDLAGKFPLLEPSAGEGASRAAEQEGSSEIYFMEWE